jgi:hypothetical protein
MDYKNQLQRIDELTKDFSLSKYNFMKISFLVRLIEDTNLNSASCDVCRRNQDKLELMVEEIPHLDDIEHRQPYEEKFNSIRTHFHKKHSYIPPHYFSSRYSIVGLIAGGSIVALISYLLSGHVVADLALAGIAFGLIVGYIGGSYMELKYRQSKRII